MEYLLLKYLVVLWTISIYSFSSAQDYILQGQLKSKSSGEPVPYASVTITNTPYGAASNEDGRFELPLPQKFIEDSLFISSLGFKTYKEKVRNLMGKGFLNINLDESTYLLKEVTIKAKAISPDTILITSLKRVPYQFGGNGPIELEYFYRSVIKEDSLYAYFIESAFKLTAKPDKKNAIGTFQIEYRAVRQSNSYKKSPLARPFVTPSVIFKYKIPINYTDSLIRLINRKAWLFELDYSSQDDELVYIIKANVNPSRYPGDGPIRGRNFVGNLVFYIRAKDYAIIRLDYGAGDYYERVQPETIPSHLRLVAREDGTLIFKETLGRFYPHYYQVVIDYRWYESKTNKLITHGIEKNEAIVQDKSVFDKSNLPLIKANVDKEIPYTHYDPAFWDAYALKDQIPLDPNVIKGLEDRDLVPIENQFTGNTGEWWTPKGLKTIYKGFETLSPKPSLKGNVSFKLNGFKEARFVSIAGDFNRWHPVQFFLKKNDEGWDGKIQLRPGTYLYKFVVDGKFISDPANPELSNDDQKNSILNVK